MEKRTRVVSGVALTAAAVIVVVAASLWVTGRQSGSAEQGAGAVTSASQAIAAPDGQPTRVAAADGRLPSQVAGDPVVQVPAAAAPVVARAAGTAPPPSPAAAGSLTAQINAATRAPHADTALLATVARRRHAIPPEVDELIRRHQAGASPKELEQWLRDHPIKDIGDRVAVLHWLREIGPDDGAAAR